ncbi:MULTISPECIES: hypothetical protein [unclassified Nostoc]|uniref:hypothetical protein n=1 Tax=unclassified Nostoc TaxID=2593658 RepID=UPI00260573E0|nr:hypothetical protein [Nostoc sp. S13]MDF5739840.1 hypothetical protein [Nostoc sp. S13]
MGSGGDEGDEGVRILDNRQSLLPRGDATRTGWCSRSWGKPPVPALLHQNPKLNCPMPNAQSPISSKFICPLAVSLTTLRN